MIECTRLAILLVTAAFVVSCKQQSVVMVGKTEGVESFEKSVVKPVIVRLQTDKSSVLAELKLSFSGTQKIEEQLNVQKETVQSLVIQTVSEFSYSDLKSKSGKTVFQNKLLSSLNQFVGNDKFKKISVVEIKEI